MSITSFDFTKTEHYTLSIRLSADGFCASVYNPLDGGDFYFQPYPVNSRHSMAANAKTFLAEAKHLDCTYRQTNILIHSMRYTTIPLEIFEDEWMETFFYQNFAKQNNEIVLCNVLGKSNLAVVFSLDKLTHLYLSEQLPSARFFASASPQIEFLSNQSRKGNNQKLYVNLHASSMEVFAYNSGKLQLANSYPVTNTDDCAYYILTCWKQLEYDTQRDELHLTGKSPFRESLCTMLRNYLEKIFIMNPQAEFSNTRSCSIEDIPFDIQSLLTCE